MALKKPKLTKNEVSQTINFKNDFGVDLSERPDLALAIGQAVLDRIEERTVEKNRGVDGRRLKKYSKDYIDSDEFKDFNKNPNEVDMTLTGRMMDDMDILDLKGNNLKIGFLSSQENAKAYNHNVGDTVPKRPFFGVNKSDIKEIKREFKDNIDEIKNQKIERSLIADFIAGLSARDTFNEIFNDFFS